MICERCGEPTDRRVKHTCPDPIIMTEIYREPELPNGDQIIVAAFPSGIQQRFLLSPKTPVRDERTRST